MTHLRIRIEEMEYRPEDKSLFILGVDAFQTIVTLEVSPVFPRQMAADLDFVARHPRTRVAVAASDGTSPAWPEGRNEADGPGVGPTDGAPTHPEDRR